MKIYEAAVHVLEREKRSIHVNELVELIEKSDLLKFGEKNTACLLDVELARRSRNVQMAGAYDEKLFYQSELATYGLISKSTLDDVIYPKELYVYLKKTLVNSGPGFVKTIDRWFSDEGALEESFCNSLIFYTCRRLITLSQLYAGRCLSSSGVLDSSALEISICEYLELTGFSDLDVEKLAWLLVQCVKESRNKISSVKVRRVIRSAEKRSDKCYICGCDIDYTKQDKFRSPEVEHIWPKSLGGPNSNNNLAIACMKCNQNKKNKLGASDFHFESIMYKKEPYCLSYEHKVSLLLKNKSSCAFCGKSAAELGGLEFITSNKDEGWHFLNVETCCPEHLTELL